MRSNLASTRAVAAVGASVVLATMLLGCSDGPSAPTPQSTVATADRPTPLIDLSCDTLVAPSVLAAAFNPETVPIDLSFDGAGGYYTLSQIGLEQAGALRCEWSDGGSADERYLLISVLPEARAGWDALSSEIGLYQPFADEWGDNSWRDCRSGAYNSCRIDVIVGDTWLSAVMGGLVSTDAAGRVIDATITALTAATPLARTWQPRDQRPTDCESLAPLQSVRAQLGADIEPRDLAAPTQPVLFHAGFLAAAGLHCSWQNSFSSVSAMTADVSYLPGGAWAWEEYWAGEPSERVTRDALDGIGDAAYSGCNVDVHCFVSVLIGQSWLDVTVNDESTADERDVATALARIAIDHLTP